MIPWHQCHLRIAKAMSGPLLYRAKRLRITGRTRVWYDESEPSRPVFKRFCYGGNHTWAAPDRSNSGMRLRPTGSIRSHVSSTARKTGSWRPVRRTPRRMGDVRREQRPYGRPVGLSRKPLRSPRRFRLEPPAFRRGTPACPVSRRQVIGRHCPPNATPRIACDTTETADPAQTSADERKTRVGHGAKTAAVRAQAILALLSEPTIVAAAARVGMGESTLRRWLTEDAAFQAEYETARRATFQAAISRIPALTVRAVDTLAALLADKEPPAVRLGRWPSSNRPNRKSPGVRSHLAVAPLLERARSGRSGWRNPAWHAPPPLNPRARIFQSSRVWPWQGQSQLI